ncbi:hypothetical protein BGV69_02130 [Burkholderia ubonensis]|nr:hypothetical protein BGV69_02130 [Burkholderia ubonensis]
MSQQQPPAFSLPADPLHHARTALRLRAGSERVVPDQLAANPTTCDDLAAAASARRPAACTMAIEPSTRTQAPGGSWQRVPGSQTTASTLGFGLNHVFNKHLTMNASVAIGLTPDAPNFVVGLRFPYTF